MPWGDTLQIKNVDTVAHSLISSHAELRTGLLLPGKTFTTTITGPAHTYSFRQTGGKGFPGKIEVDFTGRVSLSASTASTGFGRAVRLSGHDEPALDAGGAQLHRARGRALDDAGDGLQQRLRRLLGDAFGSSAAASCAPRSRPDRSARRSRSSTCGRS